MLGYTRKHLFIVLVTALCTVGTVWLAFGIFFPTPPTKIAIAGSFKGGHFEALAHRYKELLAQDHVQVDVRTTEGSVDNLKLLNDPRSGVQIAFMQEGITNGKQAPDLLSLGRIDYQVLWLFYPADETFSDLTQLKGKRIALGPLGSGTRIVAEKILNVGGVTSENTTLLNVTPQDAVRALNEGAIDALFLSFSVDSPILRSLLENPNFRLLSLTDAEALTRIFPFLARLVLPRGVIDYERKIPANDVILIATTNVVLVRKEIHPAIIDLLAQTIEEVHSAPGIFQRIGEFPLHTDPEFPVAEEALDFYKNGPSLLNRYFPFWITNYIKRTIAAVFTAIAIIIPIFSYAPRLYKWLVEYRLRALYRRLRAIEANLQNTSMVQDIVALEEELEGLDRETVAFGVPMRHSTVYFSIKSHLHLVHTRVRQRRAELSAPVVLTSRREKQNAAV
jgi:TRAP transporter TAXI family solute receptor